MDTATRVQILDEVNSISHKLIPLGKVWIQLFSLQLWVNSREDLVLLLWLGNQPRRRKSKNSKPINKLKNWPCVTSCLCGEIVKHIRILNKNTWYHITVCKLFVLNRNTWYLVTVCKLFIFDRNTWYHRTVCKIFVLDRNTWYHIKFGWMVGFYGISTFVGYLTNNQFYFNQFSLAWVHSLIGKNISISSYSVYSNSYNSNNSV